MRAIVYTTILALAACGDDAPKLDTTAKLTLSASTAAPYSVVTVTSDTPMTPTVNVTCAGVSVSAGLVRATELALLVPPVLGSHSLVIVANEVQLPDVPIEIVAGSAPPTDPAEYFEGVIDTSLTDLDALAADTADQDVTYDVYVAKQTIAGARQRFSALDRPSVGVDPSSNPDEQAVAATILYQNAQPAPRDLVSLVDVLAPLVQVMTNGIRPSVLTAATVLVHRLIPFAQAAALAATRDTPVFSSATAPSIMASSGVTFTLSITGTFRSVDASLDAGSTSASIAQLANAQSTLPGLIGIATSSAAEIYVAAPPFDPPAMSTRLLAAAHTHVDPSSVPTGVTITSEAPGVDGLSIALAGPGPCTSLSLAVIYDDGMNATQTIAVSGRLDCN